MAQFCERQGSVELLIVNDGSKDSTAAVVQEFAARYPFARLLQNPGNRGKGYSVRHGMQEAQGDWILSTDADLSSPLEEVEKLLCAVEKEKAAAAIGSRALDRSLVGVHQDPSPGGERTIVQRDHARRDGAAVSRYPVRIQVVP